jgi:AcrR family transcriptional regulator
MPRISKQKKEEIKTKILDVSKKLFIENGFFNTSIRQIAKEVGIAEGTIFNYFETKADIFLEVVAMDYFFIPNTDYSQYDFSFSASDTIMQYVNFTLNSILTLPKKVLIELSTAMLSKAASKKDISKDLVLIDQDYIEVLVEFICHLRKINKLICCDCRIIGECIFDVIVMEMIIYLNIQDRTKKEVMHRIHERINVILNGYLVD